MKILLDAGVFVHSEIAEPAMRMETVRWGPIDHLVNVQGVRRKELSKSPEFQREKDALFTVGRLIREGKLTPYRYVEVDVELWRASNPVMINALAGCGILNCEPPLSRSKFRSTINLSETILKGGKKDRSNEIPPSDFNQIPTLKWFKELTPAEISLIVQHRTELNLSPFEVESLYDLGWFKILCDRSGSPENYVDVFHLWTAERNGMALLTLDNGLRQLVARVSSEKIPPVKIQTRVFSPVELLSELGVVAFDLVPLEPGRFYRLNEVAS